MNTAHSPSAPSQVISLADQQSDVRSRAFSALLDGELEAADLEFALVASGSDAAKSLRQYALISDALRSPDHDALRPAADFHASVMAAIAREPALPVAPAERSVSRQRSWSLMAASIAAVGFVALVAQSLLPGLSGDAPTLASSVAVPPPPTASLGSPVPSWDAPRTVGLMRAHHAAPVLMLPEAPDLDSQPAVREGVR